MRVSLRESRSPPDTYTSSTPTQYNEPGLFFVTTLRIMRKKVGRVPTFCFCTGDGKIGRSTV
ncbi:protein of unknown function [Acidithiobacillus ferrivorans]|uniref:Uncharacterized protein n=1 Tax=Acidithiobacillus ferrivorans TaxID=160808 RepID=A0ABY1MQD2_9PROT|nr:protein of unknown function [Acidithiobacillus ferrivorans]